MSLEIEIKPITDHERYSVDGLLVYKDKFGNWSCMVDLSPTQMSAFKNYEKTVINNPRFKKHTKATYKSK
ncbi:hypothetical protein GCM10008015_26600 [Flavobacterium palustre]|uniref:KTSC domain-containing protein n=1 Tax=Flavobacterium palustre TaxID=1476463 RepID=A0ABQ1HNM5_9FLAO|nr:hypothetical protein [Flavobacterium palustre]GGA84487.1 hypothetical protein GCM10008015_26600 [Flavobacterium palustre]